ncbi:hypothetical protein DRE_01323 [Drechslerella stenobrocha 248]|uniref:Uncharacterized protein n=1 Tax=Drechslerella stenobrocha 248 TaxID=1043628 RepID=W7HJ87_9PEZI|nr:hypothetical protein DRE_01323 [Drechslerella stenobrocha 248]
MSMHLAPPAAQIIEYKMVFVNSLDATADNSPTTTGSFTTFHDPFLDPIGTIGQCCSIKDVAPHILREARREMDKVQAQEHGGGTKWFTDDRVYVKEPNFVFCMIKVLDSAVCKPPMFQLPPHTPQLAPIAATGSSGGCACCYERVHGQAPAQRTSQQAIPSDFNDVDMSSASSLLSQDPQALQDLFASVASEATTAVHRQRCQ